MNIILVSQCHKNALKETRRIIDQFAERTGDRTWQTAITAQGLEKLKILLKKSARKNTAVACHWVRGKNRTELLWIVGNSASFSRRGTVPTNTTERNILKSESENDWHTAEIITALSGIAALFHDFGKSCLDFQKRLNKEERKANLIRHEWISVIMFLAFVNNEDDQSWLTRLAEGNFDKDWTDRIDKAIDKPFKNLPPLSAAVCWLIVSHHRMPLPDTYNSTIRIPEAIEAQWCRSDIKDKETKDYWKFKDGTPADSATWQKASSKAAKKALKLTSLFTTDLFDPYIINIARTTLMLADHIYSGITSDCDRVKGDKDFPLHANTDRERNLNQKLDEHLVGIEKLCGSIMYSLPRLHTFADRLTGCRQLMRRSTDERFRWQDKAYEMALSIRDTADLGGFFGINMASTGCGKTRANARIMYALSNQDIGARFSVALGLRTLTLQTGREYMEMLGLNESELAVLTGGSAVRKLFEMKDGFRPSESADDLLNSGSHIYYEGSIADAIPGNWLKKTRGSEKLVSAPVMVCTIDHLMPASEGTAGGRQIAPVLRLLTSDLVLDEPDDYDIGDMYAVTRLIYFAGLLGCKVLFSSATVTPSIAEGLFEAYSSGRDVFNRNRGQQHSRKVVCAWFDEYSCKAEPDVSHDKFGSLHADFAQKRAERLKKADVRRNAALLEISDRQTIAEKIFGAVRELHGLNSIKDSKTGANFSIGLVRIANITQLTAIFREFCTIEPDSDTAIHVCCYHSRFPLILRSEIERNLDRMLKRGTGRDTPDDPAVRSAMNRFHGRKNHIFVVFASPVAEVGRDHDYDWAVAEPSSMRSLIQLAGRIRRHRPESFNRLNMYIMDKNIKAAEGGGISYQKPGYETDQFRLKSHSLKEILKKEQYVNISSIPRIIEPDGGDPEMNLSDLEHKRLRAVMMGIADNSITMPVSDFRQNYLYLTAYMQKTKPFRAGSKQQEVIWFFDEENSALSFKFIDEKGKEETALDIFRKDNFKTDKNFFVNTDYVQLIVALAEKLDMPADCCSKKFGRFTIDKETSKRIYYNSQLGFFYKEK